MKFFFFSLSLLFCLLITGCLSQSDRQQSDPKPVAKINEHRIYPDIIAERLARFRTEHGQLAFRTEKDLDQVRRKFLDEEIERILVKEKASNLGIIITEEAVERSLLQHKSKFPDRTFEEYLVDAKIPPSRLRDEISYRLTLKMLFGREVNPRIVVSEEEAKELYEDNPQAWKLTEAVRARQIVVKSEEEAKQILRKIRQGEDFAVLARNHSLGPESEKGGDLGWFGRNVMPPPIGDICFSLPVNRLSEVIESPYGFHIFEVLEKRESRQRDFSEVSRIIKNELRLEKEHAEQRAYIENLRNNASVTINESLLSEIR